MVPLQLEELGLLLVGESLFVLETGAPIRPRQLRVSGFYGLLAWFLIVFTAKATKNIRIFIFT